MTTMNPPRETQRGRPSRTPRISNPNFGEDVPVSMVDRISLILRAFSIAGPMTLAQATAHTGLPRSSVHRLLEQLTSSGWLARSAEQTYELGINAYEMGQAAFRQNRLLQKAVPAMQSFSQRTGYTIQLGVVDRGDVLYLAKTNGRRSGPTPTAVGLRVPAHLTAVGKAIMANADSGRASGAPAHLAGPTHRLTPYQQELEEIRRRGVAFDRGKTFPGISCVGVSIGPADHMYGNHAALSVSVPVGTVDERQLVGPLRIVAGEIWDRCVAADLSRH